MLSRTIRFSVSVTPEQKQRLIKAYQANKSVVGMVGDGVNDVLALKGC